jgi:hypothetical protein
LTISFPPRCLSNWRRGITSHGVLLAPAKRDFGPPSLEYQMWSPRTTTGSEFPTDLEVVKVLAAAPGVLDLFVWLSYRCFTAKGTEKIPIFGN